MLKNQILILTMPLSLFYLCHSLVSMLLSLFSILLLFCLVVVSSISTFHPVIHRVEALLGEKVEIRLLNAVYWESNIAKSQILKI